MKEPVPGTVNVGIYAKGDSDTALFAVKKQYLAQHYSEAGALLFKKMILRKEGRLWAPRIM